MRHRLNRQRHSVTRRRKFPDANSTEHIGSRCVRVVTRVSVREKLGACVRAHVPLRVRAALRTGMLCVPPRFCPCKVVYIGRRVLCLSEFRA